MDFVRDTAFPLARRETSVGTLEVHVRGTALQAPRLRAHCLRPVEVVVRRADGRTDRAAVTDPNGRTVRSMLAVAAGVAFLALWLEREVAR